MHLFISTGEPSGDLHAANLASAFRRIDPSVRCAGYGGNRFEAAGGELLFRLTDLSVMWFPHVLKPINTFLSLIRQADRYFREQRPDAVILIDYPGLHWWLARRAKTQRIPVCYFVPPQLWAWGAWRIAKMRRYVDHVICSLPFEPAWYQKHGIATQYFGHPYFDELNRQILDASFIHDQRSRPGTIVAVLPGSRQQELKMNWPSFEIAMEQIHARRPDVRFLVGAYSDAQRQALAASASRLQIPVEVHSGRTKEIIKVSEACLSVSGSVGLELLHGALPSIVAYRIRRIDVPYVRFMMKSPHLSLVNLLAGERLLPEFLQSNCPGEEMANQMLRWLDHPTELAGVRNRLESLKERTAKPGACNRVADHIAGLVRSRASRRAA